MVSAASASHGTRGGRPSTRIDARQNQQAREDDGDRYDIGCGREVQLRHEKVGGSCTEQEKEWTDQPDTDARAAMLRRIRMLADIDPRARAQQAQARRRGKHVVIEFESREA